jgi:ATP-dependent Clp protease ATP-binding subunit ClpA
VFERFTDRARRVVVLAQEEARLLDHNYIGTEHILLGIVHEGDGVGAKALESLGIELQAIRVQVLEVVGRGGPAPSGHVPFTPRAKKVLELSLREALQLGHNYIGTEHILLGLIREGDGVAAQVLTALGVELSAVRQRVIELLSGAQPEPLTRRVAVACALCGRHLEAVERWVEGVRGAVCDECVLLAHVTLEAARANPGSDRGITLPPRRPGALPPLPPDS